MGTVKIVSNSSTFAGGIVQRWVNDGNFLPYLIVAGAENQGWDSVGHPEMTESTLADIQTLAAANKLLVVAGLDWSDPGGELVVYYIRHTMSSGCKGVSDGCLWTSYASFGAGSQGTSNSAPLVASALASVLAVFPDTAPVELAKFAKACAKRSGTDRRGNTIAALLRQSGGVGVADFTCMGDTAYSDSK